MSDANPMPARPNTHWLAALLAMVFCCMPCGIVALIFAYQVSIFTNLPHWRCELIHQLDILQSQLVSCETGTFIRPLFVENGHYCWKLVSHQGLSQNRLWAGGYYHYGIIIRWVFSACMCQGIDVLWLVLYMVKFKYFAQSLAANSKSNWAKKHAPKVQGSGCVHAQ